MQPGGVHLNSSVASLAPRLLTPKLILSLSDELRRTLALNFERGPPLSENKCSKLLQLSNMLLKSTTQKSGQSLPTKSLHQVLCHPPVMILRLIVTYMRRL